MIFPTEFYSTTAQIIPVLLLTLAVERRFFERVGREPVAMSVWMRTYAVLALLSGEIIALTASGWSTPAPVGRVSSSLPWE